MFANAFEYITCYFHCSYFQLCITYPYKCYNCYMLAPNDFHGKPTCSQFFWACDFISSLILYLLYLHLNVLDNKLGSKHSLYDHDKPKYVVCIGAIITTKHYLFFCFIESYNSWLSLYQAQNSYQLHVHCENTFILNIQCTLQYA